MFMANYFNYNSIYSSFQIQEWISEPWGPEILKNTLQVAENR